MQLYDMYQDGHSPAHGTLALLTEFFSFQLAAVAIALISFSLYQNEILSLRREVWLLFVVGTALNVVVVLLLAVAVFSPKILPSLWRWLMNLAQKLFPHRAEQWRCWGEVQLSELHQCAARYRKERSTLLQVFLYLVCSSSSLSQYPLLDCSVSWCDRTKSMGDDCIAIGSISLCVVSSASRCSWVVRGWISDFLSWRFSSNYAVCWNDVEPGGQLLLLSALSWRVCCHSYSVFIPNTTAQ